MFIFISFVTPSHVVEPKYPGAFETIINLSDCWDDTILFDKRKDIMELAARISRSHEHSNRFLAAAGSILSDTYRVALDATDYPKVERYALRFAHRELKAKDCGRGKESIRFISGVTNKGLVLFADTAKALAERIYLVEDSYGAASRLLLDRIRFYALERGYDVITCCCPLSPFDKVEHLFIPELSVGFMSSNSIGTPEIDSYRIIHSSRFTDIEELRRFRNRLSLNKKAAEQLLYRSCNLLAEAKTLHDELERYYISAMDYDAVGDVTRHVVLKIESVL